LSSSGQGAVLLPRLSFIFLLRGAPDRQLSLQY